MMLTLRWMTATKNSFIFYSYIIWVYIVCVLMDSRYSGDYYCDGVEGMWKPRGQCGMSHVIMSHVHLARDTQWRRLVLHCIYMEICLYDKQ
jgi:hypothetical protein